MQFFYLFPFVVAASYAVALPQPAGLSEQYLNNVDTTLASGLQARSYQPELNSYKESATLMSLKRRDDSEGSSGEDSESDPSPPPDTTPNDSEESSEEDSGSDSSPPPETTPNGPFSDPFNKDEISSENLASTINRVGDGNADIFKDGELAIQKIDGPARDMVARYLRKAAYVNVALERWAYESVPDILELIKSGLNEDEYSKEEPDLTERIKNLEDKYNAGLSEIVDGATKIVEGDGSVIDNFQNINKSFGRIFSSPWTLLWKLKSLLAKFEAGKTLEGNLADVAASVSKFLEEQYDLHEEIMKEFGITLSHTDSPNPPELGIN
ncbi:hypothetical protein BASA50_000295 [Batrachochytrium salamandrivorans]|uniref:Uncharacterized protein n=1 Tax=Batrachochytrium salamandrivorans TaxID=1357716 RepID=A0ABQ8EU78_9FUNG|nr:hypothetical protein BASA60_005854 [Batrachochytrium salamandrivorans]KAH6583647.1 hypothetical protein BASA61_007873 [Batrachochytrium salamandrivorans]KAH6586698.1 hypothetical protein BASA50_000295 [Batrachochytrium salamandrivorans]KAH9246313.1 hypothetical protein BASA81_016145 [Batrachochytrium salamandrivorans]